MKAQINKFFTLLTVLLLGFGQMWGELTAHTPGVYEKTTDKGGYGATIVTVAERDYEVYGFSYNSSGAKPQILWAGTSTNNASASQVLCSNLSATPQEIAGWISMSTAGKSSTYSMPSSTEFAASSVGSTGLYQMKLQGHSFTIKVKGYDQFSFLGNDNNGDKSKGKYLQVTINGSDVTKDISSSTTVRRYDLNSSIESTIVITGLNKSNEHIDAFSLRLPEAPTCSTEITTQPSGATLAVGDANPELSIVATNVASYAWKESSDGTSYDGASSLGSSASFTPSVNDAVQTKYYYCEVTSSCDGAAVSKSDIVTINVVGAISYYTVTLNPAGGTIVDATGWTLNAGNYEKEVSDGAELTLPAFTKTNRTFKTWRKSGPVDVTSPITVTADVTLTAVWTATVEQVLYSWEGGSPATEVGGTAVTKAQDGSDAETSDINVDAIGTNATYKAIKVQGKISSNAWSGNYIQITTDEAVKTGDKVKITACTTKGDTSKKGSAQIRVGTSATGTQIVSDGGTYNDIAVATDVPVPNTKTFTITAEGINTSTLSMTRQSTNTNCWVTKLQIIREVQVEEGDLLTVTFNSNGGSEVAAVQVASGQTVAKPADPTKAHNRFNEWQLSGSAYNFSTPVTSSITLDATWTPLYTVTYAANGGSGTMTDANEYAAGDEVTLLANAFDAPDLSHVWDSWAVTDALDNPVSVSAGKFAMPSSNATVTAQWTTISDFDVKFFQGYGEPDVQIGATQSISTGNYATAPAEDPERAGYRFLGWSYDATEAHIVDVASYAITAATNFTAMWKAVWTVTFDGAGAVSVDNGATVASPNSPVMAGKVFQGWYNGESKYDFSAAVTGNLALESKWAVANPNHFYYTYNDDFHFDGVVYKTPDGKTKDPEAAEASNVALETNPYTLFSGTAGITSIIATNGIYDYKKAAGTKHITAYLKLKADDATSNVVFTIASGYTAVLKLKMNGYSSNATISLKKGDDAVTPSGTQEGTAEGKNYGELTYNLTAGEYKLTTANKTLYISHIDLEATALPTHTVTYKAGEGTGDDVVDADATNVADVPGSFTAPEGKIFNGWKDALDNDVAVGTIVENDMTLTAQWINHYAVTFNMNDHGDAIDPQDIKHGAKATKPADPVADGFDFGGWFTDNGTFEAPFDFNTAIVAATPLYAKWTVDPCPAPFSLSKVVLTSASDGTVTGYNGNEYAGEAVIGGLKDDDNTAEVDPSHEGVEEGYKLNGGGSGIVFATLKKGNFQEGDRVIVTITAKQNSYKIEEVSQDVLHIYYGTNASDATKLTTLESVSTAGSYTYRLKAADITAIGTKKGIGVFRESSNGQNPYVYSVEIKGCRSFAVMHTLTFKNIDGTATIAAEPLEEGAYASTVAPAAPKITMKRFLGWAEATDGTPVDLTTYTITENKTLYAVYEDIVCPTTGTVYKFQLKTDLTSGSIFTSAPGELTLNTTDHLSSMVNGEVTVNLASGKNTNRVQFYDGKAIGFANGDGASITLTLDCALATGDEIRFINYAGNGNKMNLSDGAHSLELNGNNAETVQKITVNSDWNGADELTLTRGGNTPKLTYFEIYRPAKYDVSFNMMGHGSAIADLTDVPEGSKIVAPDPAPTDVDYSFAGWYKENTLENEWDFDNDVVNAATTLYAKWLDKSDATLKSLKYGDEDITLVDGIYTYNISLPAFTSAVPALTAVPNNPNATAVPTNAAAFDGEGNATSTVLVTPESGTPQTYTVNFSKGVEVTLQDVTGSITWDFANAVSTTVNITGTPQVLANYGGVTNTVNVFESDKLEASGEKFTAGSKANLRARYIHFHTTVPGMLSISYSNTGGTNPARYIYVNGVKYDNDGSASTTPKGIENKVFVPAGDVYLEMKDGNDAPQNIQVYKIIFNDQADYTRNVTEGRYGTICLPNGGVMVGAELYEVAYYGATSQKVFLDQIPSGEMVAGRPYIFLPNEGASQLGVFYTDAANADAGSHNGLIGSYTKEPIAANAGNYILLNNQYCLVESTVDPVYVGANKAYIKLGDITPVAPALKPGAKRVGLGVAAPQTPTDIDNLNATDAPVKVMINGQMYILRGEKMYNANGQLVK